MQQGEYFDFFAADVIRDQKESGDDDEFASSGDASPPPGLGKAIEEFDGGEDAIEHCVGAYGGAFAGSVIVSDNMLVRGPLPCPRHIETF